MAEGSEVRIRIYRMNRIKGFRRHKELAGVTGFRDKNDQDSQDYMFYRIADFLIL
jgi:hypothetical protein